MNVGSLTFVTVVVVYGALCVGIGIWGFFAKKTEEEFLVASRSIGPWVGGAVLATTQMSAGTFVGTLGRHYQTGVSWIWIWIGIWLGWLVSAVFVAPKLRRFGALTVANYVSKRFGSRAAGVLAATLIIIAYAIYLTAQYQAAGEIGSSVFGIKPIHVMFAILGGTLVYSLAGIRSSSYVAFLQVVIMLVGVGLAVPVFLSHTGGVTELGRSLATIDVRITGSWYSWRELLARAGFCVDVHRGAVRDDSVLLNEGQGHRFGTP